MVTYPTVQLQPGSTDVTSVKQLQDYLVSKGLMTQAQVSTGYGTYGPQTTAAVLALQQKLGIDYSSGPGYYGPKTLVALQATPMGSPLPAGFDPAKVAALSSPGLGTNIPVAGATASTSALVPDPATQTYTYNQQSFAYGTGPYASQYPKSIVTAGGTNLMANSDAARALQKQNEETTALLNTAKTDLATTQSLGYGPNDQIVKDANGNILPPGTPAGGEGGGTPTGTTVKDLITQLKEAGITAPTVPDLLSTYQGLATQYDLEGLQKQMSDIDTQIADVQDSLTAGLRTQEGRLAPMELIGTRQLELQRQGTEKLDALNRTKANLVTQYNNTITTVKTIMDLTETDYQNASADYTTKFNQFITLDNMITGQQNDAITNARANLTILTNAISSSGKTWADIDPAMQSQIKSLEIQIGLPVGTIQTFMSAKPDVEVLSTTTGVDSNGNGVVTFIYKDPKTGMAGTTQVVKTGGVSTTTGVKYSFNTDNRGKLISSGLTNSEITALESDINSVGIDATLSGSGLNDSQQKTIRNMIEGVKTEKEFLTEEYIRNSLMVDDLSKAAKAAGFGKWNQSSTTEIKNYINYLINTYIPTQRTAGYSDTEILSAIQKSISQ